MTNAPTREQIAMAVSKSGETNKSYDEVLAKLKTTPLNDCRWILNLYPSVLVAYNAAE